MHITSAVRTMLLLLPLTLWAPGEASSQDAVAAGELCARCHEEQTRLAVQTGGHAPTLFCDDCHANRRPRRFGRRHRDTLSCTSHHEGVGHPERAATRATKSKTNEIRNCTTCHEPHGATNLVQVREEIRARRFQLSPVLFDNLEGSATGGFTDPTDSGSGLCEVCHRRTEYYRRNGKGQEHFTESCVLCHTHEVGFGVVIGEQNCAVCHPAESARFTKTNGHSTNFPLCSECHAEVSPAAEAGHRSVPACEDCHDSATHSPPGIEPFPCTQCHDAHGTDNIALVLDELMTSLGQLRPITFDNLLGKQDGSYASASSPGSGICEVCHTQTRFYRADGTGDPHSPLSCKPCHLHGNGFTGVIP
jgi:hypothetical protein